MRPHASERSEQRAIVQAIEAIGGHVYTLGTVRPKGDYPGTRQTSGLGDLWALLPIGGAIGPCGVWIEVKSPTGRLRPAQRLFRERCQAAGVPHVVGGIDAVLAWLTHGGWIR